MERLRTLELAAGRVAGVTRASLDLVRSGVGASPGGLGPRGLAGGPRSLLVVLAAENEHRDQEDQSKTAALGSASTAGAADLAIW